MHFLLRRAKNLVLHHILPILCVLKMTIANCVCCIIFESIRDFFCHGCKYYKLMIRLRELSTLGPTEVQQLPMKQTTFGLNSGKMVKISRTKFTLGYRYSLVSKTFMLVKILLDTYLFGGSFYLALLLVK